MEQFRRMMSKTFFTFILPEVEFAIHYLDMYAQYGFCNMCEHITFYYEKDQENEVEDVLDDIKPYRIAEDIKQCLNTVHALNYCLIDFLQGESSSYQDYFRTEISPKYIKAIEDLFAHKDLELMIFREEYEADILHDVYMALAAMYEILKNQESLISDSSELERILSYNLSTLRHEPKPQLIGVKRVDEAQNPINLHDAIKWSGTPAELAYLFSTLAENGYIVSPDRKDGNRNNAAFARQIYSHFNILDGSFDTLVNNLKDNRISANNQFKLAMDKLPKTSKNSKLIPTERLANE